MLTIRDLDEFAEYMYKDPLVKEVIIELDMKKVNISLKDYSYESTRKIVDRYCDWQDMHEDIPFFSIDVV